MAAKLMYFNMFTTTILTHYESGGLLKTGIVYLKNPNLVITTAKFIPNLVITIIYINKIIHILTRQESRSLKIAALAFALLSQTFKNSFFLFSASENQPLR